MSILKNNIKICNVSAQCNGNGNVQVISTSISLQNDLICFPSLLFMFGSYTIYMYCVSLPKNGHDFYTN